MKKVSVVIPVFNAQDYLRDCIESIVRQTYLDIEILLIDDGSTDCSMDICMEYAKEYEQIRILKQNQMGAGRARNRGIKEAKGEYILFADADDMLAEDDTVEVLVNLMESEHADIAVGNYRRLWNGRMLSANRHGFSARTNTRHINYRFEGFFSGGVLSYVWAKLYRRSFLLEKNICLPGYAYAEDKMFNFECYIEGARYAFTDADVYVYRKNTNSISNQYRADSYKGWMEIAKRTDRLLRKKGLQKAYGDLVAHTIFFAVFFDAKQEYIHRGRKLSAVCRMMKCYLSYPLAKEYFKQMAAGKYIKGIRSALWRIMLWGFSMAVILHLYLPLAVGIKLLIEAGIDERLSSTGKERFEKKTYNKKK